MRLHSHRCATILPEGTYTLWWEKSGTAIIEVVHKDNGVEIESVSAVYDDFSNDCRVFNGFESVAEGAPVSQFTNDLPIEVPDTYHDSGKLVKARTFCLLLIFNSAS